MAGQFMSEEEIATMLSSVGQEDNTGGDNGKQNGQTAHVESLRIVDKVFKWHEPAVKKFSQKYISPVIKSKDVIYNPLLRKEQKSDQVVVYPVEHYRTKKR